MNNYQDLTDTILYHIILFIPDRYYYCCCYGIGVSQFVRSNSNDSDDMEIKMLDRRNWSYSQAKQQQLLQLQLDYSAADVDNRLENTTVLRKTFHPHFAILRDISVLFRGFDRINHWKMDGTCSTGYSKRW